MDIRSGYRKQMQPQLWKLVVRDTNVQLLLSAIYPCETAGLFRLSCFGGANDQFVICTSKGDVCFPAILFCFSDHVF